MELSAYTSRFISESVVTFFCTINLPSTVNNDELIVTTWFGPNGRISNSSSVTLSNTYIIASGVFQSTLTMTSFSPVVDNGEYICNASVIPSSSHVSGNYATARRILVITG